MIKQFQNPERVECVRWSPGSCGRKAAGTSLLLALAMTLSSPADELSVRPSSELQYSAGAGQVFELQGSNDLRGWRDVRDVVFGEGDRISEFISGAAKDPGEFTFYRVKISPSQAFGFAPKSLLGKKLLCNDEGNALEFRFVSRASAIVGDDSLAYNYRKISDTQGHLTFDHGDQESELIELDFGADHVGTYRRSRFVDDRLDDVDQGTFALGRNSHPSPDLSAVTIPESLTGRSFLFSDGDNHERLDFVTAASGRAVDKADVLHFDYDYSVTGSDADAGASATATVTFRGEIVLEFEMRFGSDSCGTFTRKELDDGVLEDTSEGVFSCAASVYHTLGAESTSITLPVDELTGRTYVMRDGGTPCRLKFETFRSGKCTKGNQVDPFEFDYVVNCNATSTVTVRFGLHDYDEYRLNHSDEIFVRNEIRGGELRDSDSGTFSESPR